MKAGIVFDIKRYAIHDGPGIRTTEALKIAGREMTAGELIRETEKDRRL